MAPSFHFFLGALLSVVAARVLELTPSTLSAELARSASHPLILEFYAPWCGGCQELAPHFERASELAHGAAVWARIDASQYHSVALRFGVGGYPTLFHVHGGEIRPAPSSGGAEGLAAFARAGWRGARPLPGGGGALRGPLGLAGLAKFYAARPFEVAAAALTPAAAAAGLPPVAAQFLVALGAVSGAAGGLIALALCLGPRKRRGAAAALRTR